MTEERQTFRLEDAERNLLHLGWSRSGKRLIFSFVPRKESVHQIELTHDQVEQLESFLAESKPQ